jgi:hypothetical protein
MRGGVCYAVLRCSPSGNIHTLLIAHASAKTLLVVSLTSTRTSGFGLACIVIQGTLRPHSSCLVKAEFRRCRFDYTGQRM